MIHRCRGAWVWLIFLFVLGLPFVCCAQPDLSSYPLSLMNNETVFLGDDTTSKFSINKGILINDSFTVFFNGERINPHDYQVDYKNKMVVFKSTPKKGTQIKIRYQALPLINQKRTTVVYSIIPDTGKTNKEIIRLSTPQDVSEDNDDGVSLSKRGSFSRSVAFGSGRGLAMYSGLRVELNGQVAKDLELIASLTDQNTPLQPEGNTQTLQEIDKLFFQVKGKQFETTLGDYTLDYAGTTFGRYQRKLQGVTGTASSMGQEISFSAAASQGQFSTNRFTGQEGNQGPYPLVGNQGERDIIVIAGTEKVWIDGEVMRRGEDADYIIEYSLGEITFTRHRLITDASRIEVDFQYSNGRYKRGFYSVHSQGSAGGEKFSYQASLFREADDKDTPFQFSLGDENLQGFKQYQENRDIAPLSQNLGNVSLQFHPVQFLNLHSEMAVSKFATSVPQVRSPSVNGAAYDIGFMVAPENLKFNNVSLGKGQLEARWQNIGKDFHSMTRIRSVEYSRKWDVRDDELGGEQTLEFTSSYSPVSFLQVGGELGTLNNGSNNHSRRMVLRGEMNKESLPRFWFQREDIQKSYQGGYDDGRWIRQLARLNYVIKGMTPEITYESEEKKNQALQPAFKGFQFQDVGGRIQFVRGQKISGQLGYRIRDEKDQKDDLFTPRGQAVTRNVSFSYNPYSSFRNTFEIISRRKEFVAGQENITTNLVDYSSSYAHRKRGIQVQGNYQMSQEHLPLKEKVYLEVEEGRGNYRFDKEHNEYVPVERGNYLLRYLLTDRYRGVKGMKMGTTLDIKWGSLLPQKKSGIPLYGFWKSMRTRSLFRIEDKGPVHGGASAQSFSFSESRMDTSTFFGNASFLQEIFLFENHSAISVRMRLNYRNTLSNQFQNEGERRRSGEHSVRVQWNLNQQWSLQTDLTSKSLLRLYNYNRFLHRDIHSKRMDNDLYYRPNHRVEYSLQFHFGKERNIVSPEATEITLIGFTPGFRYSLTQRGRLQGNFDWYQITANTPIRALPYEMADGRNVGATYEWRLNFEYQIAQHITSNIEYRGERGRWGLLHLGRAEVRAFF